MNQNIWGPPTWILIHSVALTYPINPTQEQKLNYKNFFTNLKYILPCETCRKNYEIHLNMFPIRLDTRSTLFQWSVDMHNEVNKKNNKKIVKYDEAHSIFENLYKKHISYTSNTGHDLNLHVPNIYNVQNANTLHLNTPHLNTSNVNKYMDDKYFIMLVMFLLIIIVILLFRNKECNKFR
jgi:hypothetical protein